MMILQGNENAAMTTAATNDPIFQGNSDTPSIAIFVLNGSNGGGCAPLGAMQGGVPSADGASLPPLFPPLDSLHNLILRGISALGTGFGMGAGTAGIIGFPDLMAGDKCAEGMAEEQLSAFFSYLKDTENRADKTAQGYFYDAKAVLTVISDDYFTGVSLDKLDLSKVTMEQVKLAVQKLFGGDDYKPSSLFRLKQGWNRFCVFIGMGFNPNEYQSLISIPGIGPLFASAILAEIGSVKSFPSHAALAKYAGLVWNLNQSGNYQAEDTNLSKAGNRYLRYYLIEAANSVRIHSPAYNEFYNKKFHEVKTHQHKRALALTSRKLIRLIFGLLDKNQLYSSIVEQTTS